MIGYERLDALLTDVLSKTDAVYTAILGTDDVPLASAGMAPIEPRVLQAIASVIDAGGISMLPGPAHGCAVLSGQDRSIVTCRIEDGRHLIFIYDGQHDTGELLQDVAGGLEMVLTPRRGSGPVRA